MASKGKVTGILVGGCLFLFILACLVCCGGLAVLMIVGPGMLAGLVVDDEPLPVPTARWSEEEVEALGERLALDLEGDRTLSLSGEEFGQLIAGAIDDPQLTVFHVEIDAQDRASIDLSYQFDPAQTKYFNMHMLGEVEMEDGWFTEFVIHEWDIGKFDLGQYMAGQDMAANANQNLAQQKVQDPDMAQAVEAVEYLGIENGQFVLTLSEEGLEELEAQGEF